jgi:hypothetical protein
MQPACIIQWKFPASPHVLEDNLRILVKLKHLETLKGEVMFEMGVRRGQLKRGRERNRREKVSGGIFNLIILFSVHKVEIPSS